MDTSSLLMTAFAVLIAGFIAWLIYLQRKAAAEEGKKVEGSKVMQLQAYERLALLVERISLASVISRVNNPDYNAANMRFAIVQSINEEFTYNVSQQIYVSVEAWNAIKMLKDQNLLLVNQVAGVIPADASALDLCRSILEFQANEPKGNMNEVVSEIISYEAKKLL